MCDVTRILGKIEAGDPSAAEQLLPLIYEELRKLAAEKMAQENPGQTLQATALVHEAYIRLVDQAVPQRWESRRHFFSAAAEAMRRILVEQARRKNGRPGRSPADQVELEEDSLAEPPHSYDLLDLNEALHILEGHDPQASELVKLRFFAGLTHQQASDAPGISRRVADRLWRVARAWLFRQLGRS